MLVCEGGTSTGMISAGCLESDVIEHAKQVIKAGEAKLIEYNTASTSDEMAWGLGLGCNGIVRVLVEPLAHGSLYLEALRHSCAANAAPVLVATPYQHTPPIPTAYANRIETGAHLFLDEEGNVSGEKLGGHMAAMLERELRALSREEMTPATRVCDMDGGAVKVFIETLLPPVPLVIFGAGHDALAVVELARGLGWQTEVVDPQARPISRSRFVIADHVILSRPEEVGLHIRITPRTLTLLMSHNYAHDLALLRFLLASPARYIGVMGPRKRTRRMLSELGEDEESFRLEETELSRIYSPAGLDIGANAPAEIALSIVAEMRAVLEGHRGGSLRERRGSIHGSTAHSESVHLAEELALPAAVA